MILETFVSKNTRLMASLGSRLSKLKKRMVDWLYTNSVCDADGLIGWVTKTEVMRYVSMDVVVEKYLFYNKMHEDIEFVF